MSNIEKQKELFLKLFKDNTITACCQKIGISTMTFYNWKKKDKEFKQKYEEFTKKDKSNNIKKKKEKFLEIFELKACNISEACKGLGISRDSYYSWINNDNEFKKSVEDLREGIIDYVETMLFKNIKAGKTAEILFFLKCQAKKRGYIETVKEKEKEEEIPDDGFIEALKGNVLEVWDDEEDE